MARRAISVSPSIVRMFAQSDGSLKGAAILSRRVYDRADVVDAGKVTPLVADASIGMHTPAISIAALGPTAARATITMPKAMVEMLRDELRNGDADQHIAWDIHWGDTRASAVTEFQVMD